MLGAPALAASARISRVLYTSSFVALPPRGMSESLQANDYQRTKVVADRLADDAVRDGRPLKFAYADGSLTVELPASARTKLVDVVQID